MEFENINLYDLVNAIEKVKEKGKVETGLIEMTEEDFEKFVSELVEKLKEDE